MIRTATRAPRSTTPRRPVRLPRPRAGLIATALFLAGLALTPVAANLIEPASAGPAATRTAPAP